MKKGLKSFKEKEQWYKEKIEELELRIRHSDNLNEDLEEGYDKLVADNENLLEENEMMRSFLPPDDFHMSSKDFYYIVDEYKHKYKRKYKALKTKYKDIKEELENLVKRTPSKHLFESKDSDYSKPKWTQKQIAHWDKMIKESIKNTMKTNERSDEWRIEQFNRNRAPEEQVHSIQEMSDRVSDLFAEKKKYIYESPDGGKTLYRREFGKDSKEKVNG